MTSMWIQQGSFLDRLVDQNERTLVREPGLQYFGVEKAVVLVGSPERMYKVCQFGFTPNGGIYAQTPYFSKRSGVLGELKWTMPNPGSVTVAFEPGFAYTTSHHVKLSHPPDGRAHFSQDGRINTKVWKQTFSLLDGKGPVFRIDAFQLDGHAYVAPDSKIPRGRAHLPFMFTDGVPQAIAILADWVEKDSLRSMIVGEPTGPLTSAPAVPPNGRAFLLAKSNPTKFESRVLRVSCGTVPAIDTGGDPMVILRGALDLDTSGSPSQQERSCLAYLYPTADPDVLSTRLGTVDRAGAC